MSFRSMRLGVLGVAVALQTTVLTMGNSSGQDQEGPRLLDDWPRIDSPMPDDRRIDSKVAEMVEAMTLEEKIGQMTMVELQEVTPEEIIQYHLGAVLNGGGSHPNGNRRSAAADWVATADRFWDASLDDSDGALPVPIIWGTDAVHGHATVIGATIFPHNIGLGAARDPELVHRIAKATAKEVAVTGLDWNFSPVVAVVRDDRWGRTYESYAEDPEIVQAYAGHYVRGLQGRLGPNDIMSTTKHFVGDGGTVLGDDQGDTVVTEDELRNIHAPGYFSGLEAGSQSVMISFSKWNGEALHGHRYLINDVLKDKMGFDGFVLSDWNGHATVANCTEQSCIAAVNAGIDMFMVPYRKDWIPFIENTKQQVMLGDIPMERIDDAVTRILKVKMRMGQFRKPRPSKRKFAGNADLLGNENHRALAREAVRRSLVLLKNKDGILPIGPDARILVAGKSADDIGNMSGGWTISWQGAENSNADFPGGTSIWQAVSDVSPTAMLSLDGSAADPAQHDVAIVVIGETPYAEFFGDIDPHQTLEHARRNPEDLEVLNRIADAGVPIVTVMISGRPLYVNKELNRSDAFVAAWLPGTEGHGVTDVLIPSGTDDNSLPYDFTGRLSFSWPASDCQTAINRFDEGEEPLFAYGYGLSYGGSDSLPDNLEEASTEEGCNPEAPIATDQP